MMDTYFPPHGPPWTRSCGLDTARTARTKLVRTYQDPALSSGDGVGLVAGYPLELFVKQNLNTGQFL